MKPIISSHTQVSVISKLCILGMLKFSTLDPYGMGIEMEGGKPGWNDAMNGLPGSTSTTAFHTVETCIFRAVILCADGKTRHYFQMAREGMRHH